MAFWACRFLFGTPYIGKLICSGHGMGYLLKYKNISNEISGDWPGTRRSYRPCQTAMRRGIYGEISERAWKDSRTEDLLRATEDKAFHEVFYKEYGIKNV